MSKKKSTITQKFEVVIEGEAVPVKDMKDAENKLRNALSSQLYAYICRREYDKNGKEIRAFLTI
jgi:hypothetical protein